MNTARSRTRSTPSSPQPTAETDSPSPKRAAAKSKVVIPARETKPRSAKAVAATDVPAVTKAPKRRAPGKVADEAMAEPKRATKRVVASSVEAKPSAKKDAPIASVPKAVRPKRVKVTPELDERVREAILVRLDAMKANDLKVIDVRGKTSVTDCLVIVSGTSSRHVKSMGDEVITTAKKLGVMPLGVEGQRDAEWMLVDLGDTVVHLMLPKTREFYGLERLWSLTEESRSQSAQL